jgi:casein kinase II subunit beta
MIEPSLESESSTGTSDMGDQSWISWFCGMKDNHFFCSIEKAYIEDSFNLYGIKHYCNDEFAEALDIILDRTESEDASNHLLKVAELLYGLIHARYIISGQGLISMVRFFHFSP